MAMSRSAIRSRELISGIRPNLIRRVTGKLLNIVLAPNAFHRQVCSLLVIRVGDRSEFQLRDSCEVGWIACV